MKKSSSSSSSSALPSSPAAAFEKLVFSTKDGVCVKANSFSELKSLLHSSGAHRIITQQLLHLPLAAPLSETATVISCCHPDVEKVRKLISRFSDIKILVMSWVAEEIHNIVKNNNSKDENGSSSVKNENNNQVASSSPNQEKESGKRRTRLGATTGSSATTTITASSSADPAEKRKLVNFFSNVIGLLYGLVFPSQSTQPVACAALVEEKKIVQESEQYASANAAEKRKALQNSVLCVFSDRGQRFYFSKVWTTVLQEVLIWTR